MTRDAILKKGFSYQVIHRDVHIIVYRADIFPNHKKE